LRVGKGPSSQEVLVAIREDGDVSTPHLRDSNAHPEASVLKKRRFILHPISDGEAFQYLNALRVFLGAKSREMLIVVRGIAARVLHRKQKPYSSEPYIFIVKR